MSHEPSDSEVDAFVAAHPDGGTLEQVASLWGVTRERVRQLEARAVAKLQRELRWRRISGLDDGV